MSKADARKRELLKPPVVKPVLTVLVMIACMFFVGDPGKNYYQWCTEHSLTAQKFFMSMEKNDIVSILNMSFQATIAQLGPFAFVLNAGFWWIFASVVEKKLLSWRYPVFLLAGVLGSWIILAYGVGFVEQSQRFIGPYLFMFYVLGAYLVFKPKKPFKPQEWKPVTFRLFTGDEEHGIKKSLKLPFVSPWIYISFFIAYVTMLHFLFSMSKSQLVSTVHVGLVADVQKAFVGTISAGTLQLLRPVPAAEACLLGLFSAYILMNIVFKSKLRRHAGDMQLQAVLQYKELRALDMNHKQAVEGTAKLIGVPLDIAKDWIAKGVQTPPSDN
jgi:hypothetical protein